MRFGNPNQATPDPYARPSLRPSVNNGFGTQQVAGATTLQPNTTGVQYGALNSTADSMGNAGTTGLLKPVPPPSTAQPRGAGMQKGYPTPKPAGPVVTAPGAPAPVYNNPANQAQIDAMWWLPQNQPKGNTGQAYTVNGMTFNPGGLSNYQGTYTPQDPRAVYDQTHGPVSDAWWQQHMAGQNPYFNGVIGSGQQQQQSPVANYLKQFGGGNGWGQGIRKTYGQW